jgi:hypothetical protein
VHAADQAVDTAVPVVLSPHPQGTHHQLWTPDSLHGPGKQFDADSGASNLVGPLAFGAEYHDGTRREEYGPEGDHLQTAVGPQTDYSSSNPSREATAPAAPPVVAEHTFHEGEFSDALRLKEVTHHEFHDSILEASVRGNPAAALLLGANPANPLAATRLTEARGLAPGPDRAASAAPGTSAEASAPSASLPLPEVVARAVEDLDAALREQQAKDVGEDSCGALQKEATTALPFQPPLLASLLPIAGAFPFDAAAAQHNVDAFFLHLGRIVREWSSEATVERLGPWLAAATVLAAECLRQRRKRLVPAPGPEYLYGPAAAMWPGEDE